MENFDPNTSKVYGPIARAKQPWQSKSKLKGAKKNYWCINGKLFMKTMESSPKPYANASCTAGFSDECLDDVDVSMSGLKNGATTMCTKCAKVLAARNSIPVVSTPVDWSLIDAKVFGDCGARFIY